MSRQRRVAVTSPQTRLALARRRQAAPGRPPRLTPAETELARTLHRTQLRHAGTALLLSCAVVVGLPLLLVAVPALDDVRVGGVPVSWLAVWVLPYPALALLARWQLRRAEAAEDRQ